MGHCVLLVGLQVGRWDIVHSLIIRLECLGFVSLQNTIRTIVLISLRLTPPGLQGTGMDHEGSPLLPGAGILLELWSVWWCMCVSLLLLWRVPLPVMLRTETHFSMIFLLWLLHVWCVVMIMPDTLSPVFVF